MYMSVLLDGQNLQLDDPEDVPWRRHGNGIHQTNTELWRLSNRFQGHMCMFGLAKSYDGLSAWPLRSLDPVRTSNDWNTAYVEGLELGFQLIQVVTLVLNQNTERVCLDLYFMCKGRIRVGVELSDLASGCESHYATIHVPVHLPFSHASTTRNLQCGSEMCGCLASLAGRCPVEYLDECEVSY